MTSRQNETISVKPVRILGVVVHHLVEQYMTHWCTSHRQSRVTRFGFLDRIDRQKPDCIDRFVHQRHVRRGGYYPGGSARLKAAAERRGGASDGSETGKRREISRRQRHMLMLMIRRESRATFR